MIAHCLFEQSGTFKNEFRKLGVEAYDYDILNDYGETDFQIDLFQEIQNAYTGGVSIFDKFSKDDLIFAFFPCTMFQENNFLMFTGKQYQQRNYSTERMMEFCIDRHGKLHEMYCVLCKMISVVLKKELKMIIENPATQPHYLTILFPIKPSLIDKNRMLRGDCYKKPTQYWFINLEPKNNVVMEPVEMKEKQIINLVTGGEKQKKRSLIHPDYANRFIREFILDKEEL